MIMEDDEEYAEELHLATAARDIRRVNELMQIGINPCTPTKDGSCPLHTAALLEFPSGPVIVAKMLSYGANPNVKTIDGLSPLHVAAMWGRVHTINILLEGGANITDKDDDDKSALDYAEEADECRNQCIDSLTRWRPQLKRKGDFITRGRYNLDAIKAGHVTLSSFSTSIDSVMTDTKINKVEKSIGKTKYKANLFDKGFTKIKNTIRTTTVTTTKETKLNSTPSHLKTRPPKCFSEPLKKTKQFISSFKKEDIDIHPPTPLDCPDGKDLNDTIFQTCNEFNDESLLDNVAEDANLISSTLLDDVPSSNQVNCMKNGWNDKYDSVKQCMYQEYFSDSSQPLEVVSSFDNNDETFWSASSSPVIPNRDFSSAVQRKESFDKMLPIKRLKSKECNLSPLFIPVSPKPKDGKTNYFDGVESVNRIEEDRASLTNFLPMDGKDIASSNKMEKQNCLSPLEERRKLNPYMDDRKAYINQPEEKHYFTGPHLQSNKENIPLIIPGQCPTCKSFPGKISSCTNEKTPLDSMESELTQLEKIEKEINEDGFLIKNLQKFLTDKKADLKANCPSENVQKSSLFFCENKIVPTATTQPLVPTTIPRQLVPTTTASIDTHSSLVEDNLINLSSDQHDSPNAKPYNPDSNSRSPTDSPNMYFNIDLEAEVTVDYSNSSNEKSTVPNLVQYYEDQNEVEEEGDIYCTVQKNQSFEEIDGFNTSGRLVKRYVTFFDCTKEDTLDDFEVIEKRFENMKEYSDITVDYDWKDVSQSDATIESVESTITVPSSIYSLTNAELMKRLKEVGENPGPISYSTRHIYERYLARLEKNHEKPLKIEDKFKDYSNEMRQILMGSLDINHAIYIDYEQEMESIFLNPDKHTWREGTIKTSFNYILLDPRVTKNLPIRSKDMSVLEQFRVFVEAIFYIGKAKKSRPYEHFHEATKHEMNDRNKSCSKKIRVILDIWDAGCGVVSVHVYHNIIPVEAYTREACMVEAMSLSRLTNLKKGDYYGPAASWNIKKKRLLGVHLILKAMKIFMIEGEKQIRQKDLTK